MPEELLQPRAVLRIGRKHTQHRPRVLIEDSQVVVRTACGLSLLEEGFTETFGFVTCEQCGEES